MTELRALSEKLTSALAEALDMPADHFRRFFEPEPHIRMKVVQYPPRGSVPDPDGFGVGPHKGADGEGGREWGNRRCVGSQSPCRTRA